MRRTEFVELGLAQVQPVAQRVTKWRRVPATAPRSAR